MKLGGYRSDGTLRVLIPGGMTVLLRGDDASPPIDDKIADDYGPWLEPPSSLTWHERQELGKRLDRARTVPLHLIGMYPPQIVSAKEDAPPAEAPADAPVDTKPMSKGDVLARIMEIAKAQQDKAAADKAADGEKKAGPKTTLKRLKLEYETEDREGDEKKDDKPVSDVAAGSQTPDHLKPMDKRPPAMHFGGAGSGNFGHAGRPGEIGGSGEGGGVKTVEEHRAADAAFYDKQTRDEGAGKDPRGHDPIATHAAPASDAAFYEKQIAHAGRAAAVGGSSGANGSQYWTTFPSDHQNAFAARVMAATKGAGGADVSAVTSATATPSGIRFKTIDGHAANVINRIADRAGHRNTQRYDNLTGHYIVNVTTSKKK